jgi:hypothetical protein
MGTYLYVFSIGARPLPVSAEVHRNWSADAEVGPEHGALLAVGDSAFHPQGEFDREADPLEG